LKEELINLKRMLKNAKRLDIKLEFVTPWEMKQAEPNVRCVFAIRIPEVSIIDAEGFVRTLEDDAQTAGVQFRYNTTVTGFERAGEEIVVQTDRGPIATALVINAAGLQATTIAQRAGFDPTANPNQYQQSYYRGEYYEIMPESGVKVRALVYPVRKPGRPGLGTHLTPKIDGRLLIGPNAVAARDNTDYGEDGFVSAEKFYQDVKPFLPGLKLEHLRPAYAGIRPKLGQDAKEKDFSIQFETEPFLMVNLIGIESPGLTAALAIAEHVVDKLAQFR
jgi:L-2-hydroxyglutarate oxidase LhgO